MPTITSISAQKRPGRYNIFLDGQYAFPVSETTLIQFMLAKGMVVDEKLEAAIKAAEVDAAANSLALDFLSHQMRTVAEVRRRLKKEELPESAIAPVIERLVDLNYLDDAKFARAFLHDNALMGSRGPKLVASALAQKGVPQPLIQAAIAEVPEADWATVATRVAEKAARQTQRKPLNDRRQKIRLALMQKGFDQDQSSAALAGLDLTRDTALEATTLEAAAAKQWRLKRRYEGYDRRNRVRQALFRQGFELDAIDAAVAALEEADANA
ncbi:recombination regulator RecX [Lacticaseibacillus kribbianus]|uniref:recombination regulator RecX n=1 Tax=Lacticaseibacillus kribbianus TaxID=2926292 RepID=UPI001CD6B0C4|nr:recombination regulator RecX [Lacticaseibacillus kribbianus]